MDISTPVYILEEKKLEKNLQLLDYVQKQSGAKILLALKGFAFQASFDLVGKYLHGCCASGLHEAKLAHQEMQKEVHTYAPAFKDEEIDEIISISNHLVFNSFNQWQKYKDMAVGKLSCGLRVNPEVSASPKEIYNPCSPYSRLGITKAEFKEDLLEGIEGLHFHALCEQDADALEDVLKSFEEKFGHLISQMKWINFGGGHHITREGYDVKKLITLIKEFKVRYDVEVYLELGEAVGWQTGTLVTIVLDIVHNDIDIAILDTSAEAHMPDTIIMPYRAEVRGAKKAGEKAYTYRLAGNTCLAGDIMGDYSFDTPLKVGDKIIFEDQIHYTIVKNTTFNGIKLPDLAIQKEDGTIEVVKKFGYDEYKRRN
ncbi:MAG TPA: carboxynorspermidine decarboxylase [Campylobacterales bacterium]|nr:carboxynorspermidine decarboxylase [Campylobacterales bacterium]HIP60727.1 carboxynorspermidine decarboxylase [Campylobacterales bacterium]